MTTLASVDPNIRDHMTGVQLRLIKEKLAAERDRTPSQASSSKMSTRLDEGTVKLHQAMLRRQELMEKLKNEERIREDLTRPLSVQAGRRGFIPPPHSPTPSRRSLPARYSPPAAAAAAPGAAAGPVYYVQGGTPRQVVEHQVRPIRLDPINPAPPPPPQPQVIAMPQPMVLGGGGGGGGTKQDMMEMMMMQNAQMHSMMMQQMMLSSIPKPPPPPPPPPQQPNLQLDVEDILSLKSEKKRPKSVHHHHYSSPPPQPQQQYTLPPLMPPYPYMSPRYYPMEVEPLKQPVDGYGSGSHLHQYYNKYNAPIPNDRYRYK